MSFGTASSPTFQGVWQRHQGDDCFPAVDTHERLTVLGRQRQFEPVTS
jgi:hypothetical protein